MLTPDHFGFFLRSRSLPRLGQRSEGSSRPTVSDSAFQIAPRGVPALTAGIDDTGEQGDDPGTDPGTGS